MRRERGNALRANPERRLPRWTSAQGVHMKSHGLVLVAGRSIEWSACRTL
jgi:hypothetical protein